MSINDINSKDDYLENIENIMKEIPDLFQALANDKFD